jgi:hypothetical protein
MIYTKEWKKLRALINVHLIVNGTRTLKRGDFNVLRVEDIPKIAHEG